VSDTSGTKPTVDPSPGSNASAAIITINDGAVVDFGSTSALPPLPSGYLTRSLQIWCVSDGTLSIVSQ
jgi:hypothetical protein